MLNFPLADIQDSKYYSVTSEDVAIKSKMEGGYVVSRPRHTRKARKTFRTGFSDLSSDQKATLEVFWDSVSGGSVIFLWLNPVDNASYQVRFTKPMEFKYVGAGGHHRWDCPTIELEQA
jgi:hypothetical protein